MSKSECMCPWYSCESTVSRGKRFQFEKNEDGAICGGGVVNGEIADCPRHQAGEFQTHPYTKEQLLVLRCVCVDGLAKVVKERHVKRHNKKKGGRR